MASPIDFETQISLRREAPPNISPSTNRPLKKGLWKIYKPRGIFSEFYGILIMRVLGLSGKTYNGEEGCLVFMNSTQK